MPLPRHCMLKDFDCRRKYAFRIATVTGAASAPKRSLPLRLPQRPPDVDHAHRHAVLRTVREPSDLVVLKAVAGSLDLDHFITSMHGSETDQIQKPDRLARMSCARRMSDSFRCAAGMQSNASSSSDSVRSRP